MLRKTNCECRRAKMWVGSSMVNTDWLGLIALRDKAWILKCQSLPL
jgi:hypothetical protein